MQKKCVTPLGLVRQYIQTKTYCMSAVLKLSYREILNFKNITGNVLTSQGKFS